MGKTLVMVPTYNERDNVEPLCESILKLGLDLDVVFLDDNSPDGTGEVLEGLARLHPRVRVLHRPGKAGIGSAHSDGIRWAYEQGYTTLITMDCDFTHPPEYLPDFLREGESRDVVVGSRFLRAGSLSEWNLFRWTLTQTGHVLTRRLLGMPYDATGAYRLYRLDRLPRALFGLVQSKSYSFFFESLYLLHVNGFSIREIPIALPARTYGHSKMAARDAWCSVAFLLYLNLTRRLEPERFQVPEKEPTSAGAGPFGAPTVRPAMGVAVDPAAAEWNEYWLKRKDAGGMVFDVIAAFYRRFIIRPALNRAMDRHFPAGAELLHAGCGAGHVDADLTRKMRVTALDLSTHALERYARVNRRRAALLRGSVFELPLASASMDGAYNLGVMEHFTEEQLGRILAELRRVVRPGGKVVLFWPPSFGLSVLVLDAAHFVLNRVLGLKVKLHPDELTRIRSRSHAKGLLAAGGFRLVEFGFGPGDLFTHAILVAQRD